MLTPSLVHAFTGLYQDCSLVIANFHESNVGYFVVEVPSYPDLRRLNDTLSPLCSSRRRIDASVKSVVSGFGLWTPSRVLHLGTVLHGRERRCNSNSVRARFGKSLVTYFARAIRSLVREIRRLRCCELFVYVHADWLQHRSTPFTNMK
jgi:hypothetical protein